MHLLFLRNNGEIKHFLSHNGILYTLIIIKNITWNKILIISPWFKLCVSIISWINPRFYFLILILKNLTRINLWPRRRVVVQPPCLSSTTEFWFTWLCFGKCAEEFLPHRFHVLLKNENVKGTVVVILMANHFKKERHARFTNGPFKPLSEQH